nr:extensin-like [Penaeus vannamei]
MPSPPPLLVGWAGQPTPTDTPYSLVPGPYSLSLLPTPLPPCSLLPAPTPYCLLPAPYSLLTLCSLLPTHSLLPAPYSLLPTPCSHTHSLLPIPYSLLPTHSYSLLPTPYSLSAPWPPCSLLPAPTPYSLLPAPGGGRDYSFLEYFGILQELGHGESLGSTAFGRRE